MVQSICSNICRIVDDVLQKNPQRADIYTPAFSDIGQEEKIVGAEIVRLSIRDQKQPTQE